MMPRFFVAALFVLVFTLALPPSLAVAQAPPVANPAATETGVIDYAAWETEAARAENLIVAATASTSFLENLRATLVVWRARFMASQNANAARIATIQRQIDALGPIPAEGETEPPAIAERRVALAAQLASAQVPRVTAVEAFNRANGLISELDAIAAERKARALLERDLAPVNPLNWPPALAGLADIVLAIRQEIVADRNPPQQRPKLLGSAALSALLSLIGMVLVLRSRFFVGRWTDQLQRQDGARRGRGVLAFAISLLQVLFPILGLMLLGVAIASLDLSGEVGLALLGAGVSALVSVYLALWLAGRLFPANLELEAAFGVAAALRLPLRRATLLAGLFLGLGEVAETIAAQDVVPVAARGVIVLPVYVGLAMAFLWLTRLLRLHRQNMLDAADEGDGGFATRMMRIFVLSVRLVAILGTALAAAGYLNLAEAVMRPMGLTLGLFGLLVVVQGPIRDIYALLSGQTQDEARQALLPVLINLLLVVAALPLLALIWGMRADQLSETISRFFEGFDLGGTRITPAIILAVVLVFAIGMVATRILQSALRSTVLPRTKLDVGARNAVVSGIGYVGIALAAVIAITTAGIDLTALGVVLGALSVGIGFGLQNVVNNFVSGIILLIERPISEGDWIEVGPTMGIVKSISVRSTVIETFDRTDVIVPNADLIAGTVTNWTRGNTIGRVILTVGVAYGTDTRRVETILHEIARSHPDVARFPEPGVDFMGFGADSLEFRMRVILRDINKLAAVRTELNHRIAERFVAEGVEIPFAQRDIWLRNPEALMARGTPPDASVAKPRRRTPKKDEAAS